MKYRMRFWLVTIAAVVAACTGVDADPDGARDGERLMAPLPISEVITFDPGTPVFVSGVLFEDASGFRLCEAIGESFPVSCLGAQIVVENLEQHPDLMSELAGDGGVRTSNGDVTLPGFYGDGVLRVDPAAASADTPDL